MKHTNKMRLAIAMALTFPAAAIAEDSGAKLTPECETALALSALPARLRDSASAYTLTKSGFELTRENDGPFNCIVARNHDSSVIPQCTDAAGAETIIPALIKDSTWALAGVSPARRKERLAALADEGKVRAPERPGINYMMSEFNYVWSEQGQNILHVPPHVMFYAPGLTNEDIGGSFNAAMSQNRGTPYIVDAGIHGYMTSLVEKASDSSDVVASCDGQLPSENLVPLGGD